MFDLPVETPDNKRNYTRFRKGLLKDGFTLGICQVKKRLMRIEVRSARLSHRRDKCG
jgi:CRISPR/Cas system-associated protein endoribonuclease Cas2